MNVFTIAYNNFKNNIKVYTMFFISMVFSVVILSNFLFLMEGETLKYLGERNAEYCTTFLKVITVLLVIFMFFFIWYSSNIFLNNRKKEIGIYAFAGLESSVIGKIYFIEIMLIGISAALLGTGIGMALSKFFQVIVLNFAGYNLDISMDINLKAIIYTILVFMGIFFIMSVKGFINIVRSNIVDLLNANKKSEKMPKIGLHLYILAIVSLIIMIFGYYQATLFNEQGISMVMISVIYVVVGTYGFFGALIPIVFQFLINRKSILYNGENIITINNLAYRLRKNHITYSTIAIMTACTITVLGTAVSMKTIYDDTAGQIELYTLSFSSEEDINERAIEDVLSNISDVSDKKYSVKSEALIESYKPNNEFFDIDKEEILVLSYSNFEKILTENGNKDELEKFSEDLVKDNQGIYVKDPGTMMSLLEMPESIELENGSYKLSEHIRAEIFGEGIRSEVLIINDDNYKALEKKTSKMNFYGIKLNNEDKLQGIKIVNPENMNVYCGVGQTESINWLRFVYAIGAFLFLVLILATGSIIYMKIYNDANEDKEKYKVLLNLGVSKKEISKAVGKEIILFYGMPLMLAAVHSYYAINLLSDFIKQNLMNVYIVSLVVALLVFAVLSVISFMNFKRVIGINKK